MSYPVLAQPFHRGLYTIASDHCILVRVPRRDGGDDDSGPDTTHLETQIIREGLSPLPAVQLPILKTCEKCQGMGKVIPCECAAFDDACEACSFMRGVPAYEPDENACTCGHCLGRKAAYPIGAQVYLTPVLAIDPRYYALLQELTEPVDNGGSEPSRRLNTEHPVGSNDTVAGEDRMQLRDMDSDPQSFEGSLPYKFRSFTVELRAVVTPGGSGIVIYRGFKPIATLTRADAENLSSAGETALRNAFKKWGR